MLYNWGSQSVRPFLGQFAWASVRVMVVALRSSVNVGFDSEEKIWVYQFFILQKLSLWGGGVVTVSQKPPFLAQISKNKLFSAKFYQNVPQRYLTLPFSPLSL